MANRDDSFDDTLGDKTHRAKNKAGDAADAAFRRHDEPATTGDRVGEATGGLAGAATGAALGSLGGPIGTIIGGIAGAVGGWWSGRAISEAASTFTDDDDQYYRQHFETSRSGSLSGTERPKNVVDVRGSGDDLTRGSKSDLSYDRVRPAYQLGSLASRNPEYQGRSFDEVEPHLQQGWTSSEASREYGDWSNVRDYARDAYTRGAEQRLTLSEEELSVGKRQVSAGEVELHKRVETEHVRESVPVTREEVTIERRPLSAGADVNADIGEDEIRIPLMAEEVVVEKRVVPKEEIVVSKHAVQEEKTVEADLRRERVEYDEDDVSRRAGGRDLSSSGAADRATSSGPLDRLADKADDLKDRIDGNPRSKPGPDATDSRI